MPPPTGPPEQLATPSRVAARRLLAHELGGEPRVVAADPAEVAAAGERLVARVTGGLSRSFGPYGAVALVARALTRAQARSPVLATVTVTAAPAGGGSGSSANGPVNGPANIAGLATTAAAAGAPATLEGLTVWLAQLAELLGGLIGDDLATMILEQTLASGTNGSASPAGTFGGTSGAGAASSSGSAHHDAHTTVDDS